MSPDEPPELGKRHAAAYVLYVRQAQVQAVAASLPQVRSSTAGEGREDQGEEVISNQL